MMDSMEYIVLTFMIFIQIHCLGEISKLKNDGKKFTKLHEIDLKIKNKLFNITKDLGSRIGSHSHSIITELDLREIIDGEFLIHPAGASAFELQNKIQEAVQVPGDVLIASHLTIVCCRHGKYPECKECESSLKKLKETK